MTPILPPPPVASEPSVAVIVPARNEESRIASSLTRLRLHFPTTELVVVDGCSTDRTAAVAAELAPVVPCAPGRARQMNVGARATSADVLWFVHADVEVDPVALTEMRNSLRDAVVVGGGLSLRFDRHSAGLDYLAWSSNQRARRLGQVFGDQSMFVRRWVFEALGGFPEIALMEDLELSRRLKRVGRLVVLDATSTASARRFDEHGTWSMIAHMQYLKTLYFLGADPTAIAWRYQSGPPWRRRRGPRGVRRSGDPAAGGMARGGGLATTAAEAPPSQAPAPAPSQAPAPRAPSQHVSRGATP